jgi:hypothetical protein
MVLVQKIRIPIVQIRSSHFFAHHEQRTSNLNELEKDPNEFFYNFGFRFNRHCLTPPVRDDTKLRERFTPSMKSGHSFFVGYRWGPPCVPVSSLTPLR